MQWNPSCFPLVVCALQVPRAPPVPTQPVHFHPQGSADSKRLG